MTTGLCVIKGDDVKSGKTLIDKAAEICGSYSALAERIGTSKQALSDMKHGKREISPETAAMLADIAHEDAREAVIQAVIERNRTGPKAEQIRAILGKALAAGVAGMWVFSYSNGWTGAIQTVANSLNELHIVLSKIAARLRDGHVLINA